MIKINIKKMKYLAIIPLLMSILFHVSCTSIKNTVQTSKNTKEKAIIKEDSEVFSVPISPLDVEKAPIFPGCKGSKPKLNKCIEAKIKTHIKNKFNRKLKHGLGLNTGMQRIIVMFAINKSGYVSKVKIRSPHKKLEEEGGRLMKTLPKMTPGKHKGKYVDVGYWAFPIIFTVK